MESGKVRTGGLYRVGRLLAVPAQSLLLLVLSDEFTPGVLAGLLGATLDLDEIPVDSTLLGLYLSNYLQEQVGLANVSLLFWMCW